jgi:hypothetical protein
MSYPSSPINKECPICLELPKKGHITLDCNHLLCMGCFLKQLDKYNNCPLCRKEIDTAKNQESNRATGVSPVAEDTPLITPDPISEILQRLPPIVRVRDRPINLHNALVEVFRREEHHVGEASHAVLRAAPPLREPRDARTPAPSLPYPLPIALRDGANRNRAGVWDRPAEGFHNTYIGVVFLLDLIGLIGCIVRAWYYSR